MLMVQQMAQGSTPRKRHTIAGPTRTPNEADFYQARRAFSKTTTTEDTLDSDARVYKRQYAPP